MSGYIGSAVKRVEDKRFLTGKGQYTDDIVLPNMTHAVIIRSPHAHARIKKIDASAALAMPGVVAVFTGKDLVDDGIASLPNGWGIGDDQREPPHYPLAPDKARHVGDGVAVLIAEDKATAQDAAEKVVVHYEVLPAVTASSSAIKNGAPVVHDIAQDNKSFTWELGDKAATDAAIAGAHHVTRLDLVNQRLIPNAIEPRSAIGDYNPARDDLTLYTSSQNPHVIRLLMCAFVMGLPEHKVRVVSPDVGGGFGSKIFHYPEEVLCAWTSRKLGRPVKWTAQRSESFATDAHGRDHESTAEMAFDADGNMVALRVKTLANLGAYLSTFSSCVPTYLYGTLLAGRPEATYIVERLVGLAAHEMNVDPAELRRKNFIPPDAFPYDTPVALQYDSGNYEGALNRALEMIDYKSLRDEQRKARAEGRYIGIGFSSFIEACGIAPSKVVGMLGARAGLFESGLVRVHPTGKVQVFTGSHSHGQGHETTFAQIVASRLGIDIGDVEVVHGDTGQVPFGMGTYGSRSLAVGGSAIVKALDKIVAKAKKIAAHKLEAAEDDLDFTDGKFTVKGTDRSIGFADISLTAYVPHDYPEGLEPGLEESGFYDPVNFTFPFGTHISVVEIDSDTGKVHLRRYVSVDDVGNVINPMIVDGQLHGGIAHGIGQALYEGAHYDESGQLVTGTFMDYAFPKADDLISFETDRTVTPCPHNPLGVKGAGEAGTIAATACVANAVIDALYHKGIRDLPMPFTSERVWRALQNGHG